MERLRNIEDLTLAMADEGYYDLTTARWVLRAYLERGVSYDELNSVVGRLSNSGLLRWRIVSRRRKHFRSRASVAE